MTNGGGHPPKDVKKGPVLQQDFQFLTFVLF